MPRFERILFPVDFSERSRAAAPFVLSLAQRYGSRVDLFHAVQPPPPFYAGMNNVYPETFDFESAASDIRKELGKFAEAELPKVDARYVAEMGDPAFAIAGYVAENGVDLIAMPTHGYGVFRRALLGSVTAKVLHDVNVPVWTSAHAPEPSHRAHPKPRHIVCAIDLKSESRHTLEFALEVAREADASIELLHVAPEGETAPEHTELRLQELLVEAARGEMVKVQEAPPTEMAALDGSVADMVRSVALSKRADLVVIGRGREGGMLGRLWSHSYSIIREAPCPVLSV